MSFIEKFEAAGHELENAIKESKDGAMIMIAIEGDNVVVTTDPLTTKDHTLGLTMSMYIGIDSIVGSKFGILDVS